MTADPIALDEDPLATLDPEAQAAFTAVAGQLIPAAHGMPSAADVVGDARLRFVLTHASRPRSSRSGPRSGPGSGEDATTRLAALEQEPDHLAALLQTVVFGYYTDRDVRERLDYPGQEARQLYSWKVPDFIEEGLTDQVLARGPIWRDPATGRRAEPR